MFKNCIYMYVNKSPNIYRNNIDKRSYKNLNEICHFLNYIEK